MPARGKFRRPTDVLVVFDGQSLNLPENGRFPEYLMSYFPGVRWSNPSIGGTPWGDVAYSKSLHYSAPDRVFPLAHRAKKTILVMNGATADYNGSLGATPPQNPANGTVVYNRMVSYAAAARLAGFKHVVNVTTPPASYLNTSVSKTGNRLYGNATLLAQPDYPTGPFEGIANLIPNVGVDLDNVDDPVYYQQQGPLGLLRVHWTNTGGALAAARMQPILAPLI